MTQEIVNLSVPKSAIIASRWELRGDVRDRTKTVVLQLEDEAVVIERVSSVRTVSAGRKGDGATCSQFASGPSTSLRFAYPALR